MGLGFMMLAMKFRCPCCIEITKSDESQFISLATLEQRLLIEQFRHSIWIHRILRMSLTYRHFNRLSVSGTTGREDDLIYSVFDEAIEKIKSLNDVVLVIKSWLSHRLADIGIRGEMKARIYLMRLQNLRDNLAIADVCLIKNNPFLNRGTVPS